MSLIRCRKLRYQADMLPLEPIGGNTTVTALAGNTGYSYNTGLSISASIDDALANAQENIGPVVCDSLDTDIEEDMTQVIYYVSDIHIEHQLEVIGKTFADVRKLIRKKVKELVSSIDEDKGTILVAGDVADSVELTNIFYDELNQRLLQNANRIDWRIIAVLGNHELWNASQRRWFKPNVTAIIRKYKKTIPVQLLENELFVNYKGKNEYILDEETILKAEPVEIADLIMNSTVVILGGIGFSGRNPIFNATKGLYRDVLTPKEDVDRTQRFSAVYDKVLQCAETKRVIVLTHTQMQNWSTKQYNPNWVYINGHTHQNTSIRSRDGATVFSDNQIGYKPQKIKLKSFRIKGVYDPFDQWSDGIYRITAEQYQDFNRGRGISMGGFKREGEIYAIKRNNTYMFFLKRTTLCVLEGGRIRKATHDIEYYYDNLPIYCDIIKQRLRPYREALKKIAREVKLIGGDGRIHGCIVDVDFLHHIFLNPFDGSIIPYCATDMEKRTVFPNVLSMLKSVDRSIYFPNQHLTEHFVLLSQKNQLPLLSGRTNEGEYAIERASEIVYDKKMYQSSRIMRSMQYVFEGNVVRIWRDELLEDAIVIDMGISEKVSKSLEQITSLSITNSG